MNDELKPGHGAPDGAVTGEGPSLSEAIAEGASLLGLHPSLVQHKLDLSHFRNAETGRNVGVDTVKVWVWPKDQSAILVVERARAWMQALLQHMGLGGEVDVDVRGCTVLLRVRTEAGGQLVGRQGATLEAVRGLLTATLGPENPRYEFRVDVADPRREDRGEGRDRRPRRGEGREDRGEGRDRRPRRGEERERGHRDRERPGREHGRDHHGREPRGRELARPERAPAEAGERPPRRPRDGAEGAASDEANAARNRDVERLAHRLAKKVQQTGEAELIRREMNSYARRLVHMVVAEYPGLATESVGEGTLKQIRILPAQPADEAETP